MLSKNLYVKSVIIKELFIVQNEQGNAQREIFENENCEEEIIGHLNRYEDDGSRTSDPTLLIYYSESYAQYMHK